MRSLVPVIVFLSGMLAAYAAPSDGMKPGLWEITRSSPYLGQWHERMEHMPPEARKAMEEVFKSQNAAFAGASGKLVKRLCLTPEQAANYRVNEDPGKGGCKWDKPEHSGSGVRIRAQCPGSWVEAVLSFSGDTAFTGSQTLWLGSAPAPSKEEVTGKWLGARCDG